MNQTPLMAAAAAGNVALVEALLERGADRDAVDHYGYNALHWAMREAFRDAKFARGPFAALYELLAPASIDVNTGERLVRIDRHLSEYFLFQTLWVLFKSRFTTPRGASTAPSRPRPFSTPGSICRPNVRAAGTQQAPASLQRPGAQRNRPRLRLQPGAVHARRAGLVPVQPETCRASARGARNLGADIRGAQSALRRRVRRSGSLGHIDALFAMANQPPMATPIAGARIAERMAAEQARQEAVLREIDAVRREAQAARPPSAVAPPPATRRRHHLAGEPGKRAAWRSNGSGSRSR